MVELNRYLGVIKKLFYTFELKWLKSTQLDINKQNRSINCEE